MNRTIAFALLLIGTIAVVPQTTQTRKVLTTADYDRAARMLGPSLTGLVVSDTVNANWLADGRFWYTRTTLTGTENIVIDPAKKTREVVATPPTGEPAAAAPGGGGRGGRGGGCGRGGGRGGAGTAAPVTRTCGPNVTGTTGTPPLSMSPDGTKAVYICDWNLWLRDVASGQDKQLTTDGVKDFGYATSNAGWQTSAAASLSWSPDSKKIATQQQDERKVGDMYLVQTPVNGGHPVLRAWKYPLAGDPDVAEFAHAGSYRVRNFVSLNDIFDSSPRLIHKFASIRHKQHGAALYGHLAHRFQCQIVSVDVQGFHKAAISY